MDDNVVYELESQVVILVINGVYIYFFKIFYIGELVIVNFGIDFIVVDVSGKQLIVLLQGY